ncbi:DUF421 domain-containing protein [Niallia sp. 01092]|uniref:DUF421 domain-containing protein n=1 Tax=unclassified Niallia TaxID=2837522 RepID=UPI003FCF8FBC
MDFFHGQESLTSIQWILRAIVSFFFLIFVTKIMGQRSISQLRLLDFVVSLVIGNVIAHPLSDEQLGLKGSMITITVLMTLYLIGVYSTLKWHKLRIFFDKPPYAIIENGQIHYKNLVRARISIDILLSELRKNKIKDVQNVSLALWEPDGTISFFLSPAYQTVTPDVMHLATKPFTFPRTIILDGKIDKKQLDQMGKNEDWLKNKINTSCNSKINDILLATIDHEDNLKIFLYR